MYFKVIITRLQRRQVVRWNNSSSSSSQKQQRAEEEEQAPQWLQRMAPTRGGMKPPNKVEAAVIGIVGIFGFYAWFIDPGSMIVKAINYKEKEHQNDTKIEEPS